MNGTWPVLPAPAEWQAAYATLHMWLQIAGKIRLALSPPVNHSWGSTLYVTTRGFTTSPIPWQERAFAIDFDFIAHRVCISTTEGETREVPLEPMSVATFHARLMEALDTLAIRPRIWTRPVEVVEAIAFEDDTRHAAYDGDVVQRVWRAFVHADRVLRVFRARFTGKASPVHLFWGAFDLAATRFSGRTAPLHPGGVPNCADRVMQEAYSHELASAGFWPGAGLGEAAFYAYAWPEPEGYRERVVQPAAAYFSEALGEFILPYEAVRTAANPDALLLEFLQTTYEAAAELARWDRRALERD